MAKFLHAFLGTLLLLTLVLGTSPSTTVARSSLNIAGTDASFNATTQNDNGYLCGPPTNVPAGACGYVLGLVRKGDSDTASVPQGNCAIWAAQGCKGLFCAGEGWNASASYNFIADTMVTLWEHCVNEGGRQGFAFDCFDMDQSCETWAIYLTNA